MSYLPACLPASLPSAKVTVAAPPCRSTRPAPRLPALRRLAVRGAGLWMAGHEASYFNAICAAPYNLGALIWARGETALLRRPLLTVSC